MIEESKCRVGYINEMIESGRAEMLVAEGEQYHTQQLQRIAEEICSRAEVRVVLIAGPSSSGKTSTSHKLCIALENLGKQPVTISLDNWFLDLDKLPCDATGKKDYESVYALDLERLAADMNGLIAGEEVELPVFNFLTARREEHGERLQLSDETILIIEGIHALNPLLSAQIDQKCKYRIYAAPMSHVSLDGERWVPTYVNRLLRRMSRDLRTRGKSAQATIAGWPSVIEGEAQWIEPFRTQADAEFDTAMTYELSAIRMAVETALQTVPVTAPEYKQAEQLLYFLSFFEPLEASYIPRTSILREFIGGSQFNVG